MMHQHSPSNTPKAAFMSNAKWRKLIAVLEERGIPIIESHWEYLGNPRIYTHPGFPQSIDTTESGLRDGRWAPIEFKEIYRITIPRDCRNPKADPHRSLPLVQQPIDEIFHALISSGSFPIRLVESGLELTAYAL